MRNNRLNPYRGSTLSDANSNETYLFQRYHGNGNILYDLVTMLF